MYMNPTFNVYTIMYTELPSSPNNLGGCSTIIKIINLSGKPTLLDKHLYIFFWQGDTNWTSFFLDHRFQNRASLKVIYALHFFIGWIFSLWFLFSTSKCFLWWFIGDMNAVGIVSRLCLKRIMDSFFHITNCISTSIHVHHQPDGWYIPVYCSAVWCEKLWILYLVHMYELHTKSKNIPNA